MSDTPQTWASRPSCPFHMTLSDVAGVCFQAEVVAVRVFSALGVYEVGAGHCPMALQVMAGEVQICLVPPSGLGDEIIATPPSIPKHTPRTPGLDQAKSTLPEAPPDFADSGDSPVALPPQFDHDDSFWSDPLVRRFMVQPGMLVVDGPQVRLMVSRVTPS